jgi:radial spoke head protein 4A
MVDAESTEKFLKIQDSEALYDHLTNVLLSIVKERPENALTAFESGSVMAKTAETSAVVDEAANAKIVEASQSVLDLIKPPKKGGGGEDEEDEEEEEKEAVPIPDLMAEASLLSWAGFGLSQEEMYIWTLSIQALATDKELQNVRFWGVVRGTAKDYYVVEAKLEEYPEEEGAEDSKKEAMGTGANECLYYVANSATGEWTQLPAVDPSHIILATQMKRFFTGNLEASVLGFPRFPYGEKALLRAQIARITAGAYAVPKDVFIVDPDDEEMTVTENEEYKGITPMLSGASSWVHGRTHLLKEGRTTEWVSPDAEDEDEEDEEGEETKKDEGEKEIPPPKLRALGEDEGVAWKFDVYPSPADTDAVVTAVCNRWPGAVAVAQGKTYVNFYVGYGHKLATVYSPPLPPPMQEEYSSGFDPATAEAGVTDPLLEQSDTLPPEGWTPPEDGDEEEELGLEPAEAANPDAED